MGCRYKKCFNQSMHCVYATIWVPTEISYQNRDTPHMLYALRLLSNNTKIFKMDMDSHLSLWETNITVPGNHQPKDELCCGFCTCVLLYPRDGKLKFKCYVMIISVCTFGWIKINTDIYTEGLSQRKQALAKECRCSYELRFNIVRWFAQIDTWLSEPQGWKVRRKSEGIAQRGARPLQTVAFCFA